MILEVGWKKGECGQDSRKDTNEERDGQEKGMRRQGHRDTQTERQTMTEKTRDSGKIPGFKGDGLTDKDTQRPTGKEAERE